MKPIKILSICLGLILISFFYACSKSDVGTAAVLDPNAQNISIQSMAFSPASVTVMVGTKIVWTNTDTQDHTVTSDDGTSFNSGNISPQGTFSFTPSTLGTYTYHCSIHPTMTGTVQVVTR